MKQHRCVMAPAERSDQVNCPYDRFTLFYEHGDGSKPIAVYSHLLSVPYNIWEHIYIYIHTHLLTSYYSVPMVPGLKLMAVSTTSYGLVGFPGSLPLGS